MNELEIFDCEQGSEEWFSCRLGVPSASNFATIMAKGRDGKSPSLTRKTYLYKLAGEIVTGKPSSNYKNAAMERGNEMEEAAAEWYSFTHDVELTKVGFMKRGPMGCSPDRLIGDDGGLEIKTAEAHILIEHMFRDDCPPEHVAQVQGTLLVTGRDYWNLMVFWPDMPPPVFRVRPDRAYQANLKGEIDRFNDELAAVVERVRAYGR